MQSGDNCAHSALVNRYGRENNALGKNPFLEEAIAELHRQGPFTYDDRRDRRLAVPCIIAKLFQSALEKACILPETLNKAVVAFKEIQGSNTGCHYRGWMRGTEEHGTRTLQQVVLHSLATSHIAAQRSNTLGERADLQSDSTIKPKMADRATPIF